MKYYVRFDNGYDYQTSTFETSEEASAYYSDCLENDTIVDVILWEEEG